MNLQTLALTLHTQYARKQYNREVTFAIRAIERNPQTNCIAVVIPHHLSVLSVIKFIIVIVRKNTFDVLYKQVRWIEHTHFVKSVCAGCAYRHQFELLDTIHKSTGPHV